MSNQYIASLSYGKDSIAMLEVIKQNNMPLDRIVHVEVMATKTIPADLPEMVEFKKKADKIIKQRYGIEVEHLKAKYSYEEYFYKKRTERSKCPNTAYGFPMIKGNWCNSQLKANILKKLDKLGIIQYIGIAFDEPNRFKILSDRKISPLVEYEITETQAKRICEELDLLSPIYKNSLRGGCWFCHNQTKKQLRFLRKNYPEYWELMLKWDKDSPVTFRTDGTTIHDFEIMFAFEDSQISIFNEVEK